MKCLWKALSLLLVLAAVLSLCAGAWASGEPTEEPAAEADAEAPAMDADGDIETDHDNHLSFCGQEWYSDSVSVPVNERVVLTVPEVTADDTDGISYRWQTVTERKSIFGYTYPVAKDIPGAVGPSYTTEPVTEVSRFQCVVTDKYGNSIEASFTVSVDNGLLFADGDNWYFESITLAAGDTSVLTVPEVTAADTDDISYHWEKAVIVEGEGWKYSEPAGANGSRCTTDPVTGNTEYTCTITDKYGNELSAEFYIRVENHLLVNGEEGYYTGDVTVTPGQAAELTVRVSADVTDGISYRWLIQTVTYGTETMEEEQTDELDGETGATLHIPEVTRYTRYICEISDTFGNTATAVYSLIPENHFRLVGAGGPERTLHADAGQTLTLTAEVAADDMTGVRHRWFAWIEDTELGYETWTYIGDAASVEASAAEGGYAQYTCVTTDRYGTPLYVLYFITEGPVSGDADGDGRLTPSDAAFCLKSDGREYDAADVLRQLVGLPVG